MAVATSTVVEHFNVIEDIGSGQIAGFVVALADAFFFQAAEERLRDGVVPADDDNAGERISWLLISNSVHAADSMAIGPRHRFSRGGGAIRQDG